MAKNAPETPKKKKKAGFCHRPLTKIIAAMFCVVVLSSGMTVYINSDVAYADKFKLEQLIHEIKGKLFAGDDESQVENENAIIYTFESMDDIKKAKKILPELYVPNYIPVGYKLGDLEIKKYLNQNNVATYNFKDESKSSLKIMILYLQEAEDLSLETLSEVEKIMLEDRTIYIWFDDVSETNRANIYIDNNIIMIFSELDHSEIAAICEQIN